MPDLNQEIERYRNQVAVEMAIPAQIGVDRAASNSDRTAIIAQSLETSNGKQSFAQAMVEPIRRALDYEGIGRRLLAVDELPNSTWTMNNGSTISLSEIRQRRFDIIDRSQIMARESIQAEEDQRIFSSINSVIASQQQEAHNEYLKQECELEELKKQIPHYSIMWLEV